MEAAVAPQGESSDEVLDRCAPYIWIECIAPHVRAQATPTEATEARGRSEQSAVLGKSELKAESDGRESFLLVTSGEPLGPQTQSADSTRGCPPSQVL